MMAATKEKFLKDMQLGMEMYTYPIVCNSFYRLKVYRNSTIEKKIACGAKQNKCVFKYAGARVLDQLLRRGDENGFEAKLFHTSTPTLTIIKSQHDSIIVNCTIK